MRAPLKIIGEPFVVEPSLDQISFALDLFVCGFGRAGLC